MNEAKQTEAMSDSKRCPQCGATLPAGVLEGLCPACLLRQGATPDSGTQPAATPFEPPAVAEVARLFPQLEILALIGKGGMGAVYKARQPALDRWVALKILPPVPAAGASFADRFNREARALARLSHPNIVGVHEFGQASGLHYSIMEYVDGANLRQLEQAGRLSPREALQIIPQICDALQYAHDEGVVHRDIKPENVLVDRKGRVKIADFGLAKILGHDPEAARLTAEGQVMGTPHYMAPEQVEHPLEVDHRADIYALGVVFYEMLTGELPLGKFAPPSRKVQVDVRFDEVVLHALEKEPEHRYQHASEVKTAVETIACTAADASACGKRYGLALLPAYALYGLAVVIASIPFLALGMDPGDPKHLERFVGCPIVALVVALFGKLLALGIRSVLVRLGHPAPPREVGRRVLQPRVWLWLFPSLMVAAYLVGWGARSLTEKPDSAPSEPAYSEMADAAAVQQVAEGFLAAIHGRDDAVLQSLAYDSVPGWRKALPHFAEEIRQVLHARGVQGEPLTEISDRQVKGDWAAVKVPGPKEAGGIYLVLLFTRTPDGWRNGLLKNSAAQVPLKKHLDDYIDSLADRKPTQ
jgi:hypothetical protein